MREDIVLRLYELRHPAEEAELLGEVLAQDAAELVHVVVGAYLEAHALAHLREQPRTYAAPVREQIVLDVPVRAGLGAVLTVVPVVAVAEDEYAAAAPVQLHEVAERVEALRPLLHYVADEHERVLAPELQLRQEPLEVIEVPVHVRDGYYPPLPREGYFR